MNSIVTGRLITIAATVLALLLLRAGSLVGVPNARSAHAWVRLSWSARPERVEQCRRLSDEELAQRPEHMRLRLECTGAFARYLLQLSLDGVPVVSDTVRGGFRNDRPMHVWLEVPLAPGRRQLHASLSRIDSLPAMRAEAPHTRGDSTPEVMGERESRERDERRRRAGEGIPPQLVLDTVVTLGAARVLLITYDETRRVLAARSENK